MVEIWLREGGKARESSAANEFLVKKIFIPRSMLPIPSSPFPHFTLILLGLNAFLKENIAR
jgi:hypothetical protein